MTRPLVSVIIPSFNHSRYLEKCLRSVLTQDYRPIEIIFIDDGSADESYSMARDILLRANPSSLVLQQANTGAANTINRGIALSRGSYINILNSDDFFEHDRISSCVDLALRVSAEFIFTDVTFVNEHDAAAEMDDYLLSIFRAKDRSKHYYTLGYALTKTQLAITTGNFFFSRTLFDLVGPFRNYRYVHDWDFLLRVIFYVEPLWLKRRLYAYRLHPSNSFKSLKGVEGYETKEVMRNFFWSMIYRHPINGKAPSPKYWPGLFEQHIRELNYDSYLPPQYRFSLPKETRVK